ncbi:hypothetical protein GW932_04075, partial [archaeon]|nr:hypothetical protein [archaeon]
MKNKNIYFLIGLVFLTLFSLNFISAIDACCEKTINGATCVYTDINNCDKTGLLHYDYGACEYLDYCTLGTCIDEDKITCESNTPKATCEERGGLWDSRSKDTIPECQPGCCYYGNDAILTTKAGCNKFEDYYSNLETYFAPGVSMEDCEGSVNLDELGACVQESLGGTKDCQILTNAECSNKESMSDYPVNFYEGYLCTADILGNICEKTKITECRDNLVYLKDSCGNFANVYDHNKLTLDSYWQTILPKNEFCVGDLTNLNECGNCENGIGSVCVKYEPGKTAVPKDGVNNVCSDSTCTFRGEEKQYGDRWCITNAYKDGEYLPGVTEAVGVCQDGEVTILPCESGMREEICIEQGVGNARCVDNNWEICNGYDNKEDCENPQDFCEWHDASWYNPSDYNSFNERILTFATGTSFELDEYMDTNPVDAFGYCSPKYAPGINFWEFNDESKSEEICTQNSYTCNVIWAELREFAGELKSESGRDKFLEAGFECVDKDGNLREDWLKEMNNKCALSSDCGLKNNFLNKSGKIKELSNFVTREKGDAGEWKLQEADLTWGSVGRFLNAWGNSLANNLIYIRKVPETITFNCNPWEAEYGGENCEVCNTLPLGCSEYECKSLGQYCDVDTDENTGENFCFFKDSNDITPPKITFLPETLSEDF